jgi:hypothetical protein
MFWMWVRAVRDVRGLRELVRDHELAVEDVSQGQDEPARRGVLRDEPGEAHPQGVLHEPPVVQSCECDHRRLGSLLEYVPTHGDAAPVGQPDIEKDELRPMLACRADRARPGGLHADHVETGRLERHADRLGEQPVVVHDQDADARLLSAGTGSWMQNSAPRRDGNRRTVPPWASRIRRAMKSPRPVPPVPRDRTAPRVKGSKMASRSRAGMPGPRSRTITLAAPSTRITPISTFVATGANANALRMTFTMAVRK